MLAGESMLKRAILGRTLENKRMIAIFAQPYARET